ncbi:hypothetical protein JG688_00015921 [Phytophthora aleatoria]|uniref:Uncharacterized protein n=1 Tax=Phytophthora aleatoria TaxID=2496075 RepID=A0A8J5IUY0_9STRA|nr:hypothetical protein JG688_00015921 [Phytophthora aleatoria]
MTFNHYAPPDVVRVVSKPCPRIFDPEVGRTHEALLVTAQLGMHLARTEVQGMPSTGWLVSTSTRLCSCRFFKNTEHVFTWLIHCPSMAFFALVSVKRWSIAVRTKPVAWRASHSLPVVLLRTATHLTEAKPPATADGNQQTRY